MPTEAVGGALLKPPHPTQVDAPAGAPGTTVVIRGSDFGPAGAGIGRLRNTAASTLVV